MFSFKKIFLLMASIFMSFAVFAQNNAIDQIIHKDQYAQSNWGILVKDLTTGKIIYSLNPDKLFVPGSVTKLYSVGAALATLKPNFRYKTPVYMTGTLDKDGVLHGNLILVASGDLTFGGRTQKDGSIAYTNMDHTDANAMLGATLTNTDPLAGLNSLSQQIAKKGIKRIDGEIIIDTRLFEQDTDTSADHILRTPIVINDNLIDFVITPAKDINQPATITAHPKTAAYHVDAYINTVAANSKPTIQLNALGEDEIILRGEIPMGHSPMIVVVRPKYPDVFARSLFIESLKRHGIETQASALNPNPQNLLPPTSEYKNLKQVALFVSPPFSETTKLILKVSHNLGANLMPMQIAAFYGKNSFEDGLMQESKTLQKLGVNMKKVSISDGEGGDPSDYLSPETTVQLLSVMYKTPYFKAYFNSLPILGVDGTLYNAVSKNSPVRGQVFAKTGTIMLGDVANDRGILKAKAMAGYMKAKNGHLLAFAIFINNVPIDTAEEGMSVGNILGDICSAIYEKPNGFNSF